MLNTKYYNYAKIHFLLICFKVKELNVYSINGILRNLCFLIGSNIQNIL